MLFSLVLGCRKGWGWAAAFPENRNWQEGTEEWMFPRDQYVEIPHLGKGGDGAEQELRSPHPRGTGLSRSTPTPAAVSFPSHRAALPFWAFASLTASTRSMPLLTAGFFFLVDYPWESTMGCGLWRLSWTDAFELMLPRGITQHRASYPSSRVPGKKRGKSKAIAFLFPFPL